MQTSSRARLVFVVNPTAGHGRAASVAGRIRRDLEAADVSHTIHLTNSPEETEAFAAAEAGHANCVVAVGGDGTVHRTVKGLLSTAHTAALGVLPVGTGNDFARSLGLTRNWKDSLDVLVSGVVRRCDYGVLEWNEDEAQHASIFVNVAGIGFDAVVAGEALRYKRLPGLPAYVVAALSQLPRWRGSRVRVTDGHAGRPLFSDQLFLMSVGNGPTAGGGFHLTPGADIADGALDACIVRKLSVARALTLLPLAIRGRHVRAREVTMVRSADLWVASEAPVPVHADGEVLTLKAWSIRMRVVAGGLPVMMPRENQVQGDR